jgi:enoyl-CoA hydratase/carnithine racemase
MIPFDEYRARYRNIRMERERGVCEIALHTDGGPLLWNETIHEDLPEAFHFVAQDLENRVVILTGTGDAFCEGLESGACRYDGSVPPVALDRVYREGKALLNNQLAIPVPMIAAVNGPARAHCQLALLCDIVVAADTAVFQDRHLEFGVVPGDGIHVAFSVAFGPNRARYLVLTGKPISAQEALGWGGISEVLPLEKVRDRSWELARQLAKQSVLALRYTRELLVRDIQRQCHENLALGLGLEGFGSGFGSWLGKDRTTSIT